MNESTRPISSWPGPETPAVDRRRSPFRTTWDAALRMLRKELGYLGATSLILEIDLRPGDFRRDGMPRADARPVGPRIIVYSSTRKGDLKIPCDSYLQKDANLYAIALTLEKLRAIDRYGVTLQGEQYRGFTAIPATTSVTTRVAAAWLILADEAKTAIEPDQPRNRTLLDLLFGKAARRAHPDAGGTDERMSAVNRARDTILLDLHG